MLNSPEDESQVKKLHGKKSENKRSRLKLHHAFDLLCLTKSVFIKVSYIVRDKTRFIMHFRCMNVEGLERYFMEILQAFKQMSDVELQAKKVSLDVWQDVKKRSV